MTTRARGKTSDRVGPPSHAPIRGPASVPCLYTWAALEASEAGGGNRHRTGNYGGAGTTFDLLGWTAFRDPPSSLPLYSQTLPSHRVQHFLTPCMHTFLCEEVPLRGLHCPGFTLPEWDPVSVRLCKHISLCTFSSDIQAPRGIFPTCH